MYVYVHTHTLLILLDCLVNHFATFMKHSVLKKSAVKKKKKSAVFPKEILPIIVFRLGYGIPYSKEKLSLEN